jgi:tetratricopeptide (TPR) repeat protein
LRKHIKIFLLLFVVTASCSTEKNTLISRTFHNTTSNYNIYFNGKESFKKGLDRAKNNHEDNFSKILPLFYYQSTEISQQLTPDMNRAIEKATKVITLHSIKAKPELKKGPQTDKQKAFYNQKEYNKWIGDNFTLMGKAYVYKQEYHMAIETFKKVVTDFPNDPVHYEALFWMARAYNETKEYRESEKILNGLINEKKIPDKYKAGIFSSYADLYIKEGKYDKAVPMLKSALAEIRNKQYKIRYTYILAQLNQQIKHYPEAIEAYKKVIKMNPPYEFTFNAKINMAESFEGGSENGREIEALLRKMLKDDKNIDFHDQIYYALGNISSIEGKKEEAIKNYQKSVQASTNNFNQKGLSYLALGDIYYIKPDYILAQLYYDSSIQNISPDFEKYTELSLKTKSLTNLVSHLSVYNLEDSLQNLASLPKNELNKIIDAKIEEVIKKEQEELERKKEEMQDLQYGMAVAGNQKSNPQNQAGGSWYFYNLNAKSFGQPEFKMKWGNRKLEDNWRRKNKQTIDVMESSVIEETLSDTSTATEQKMLGVKSREYYLKNIPFSDSAKALSHVKLEKALFNMGLVYRNELKDNNEAIKSFKEQITRYPNGVNALLAYYNLYELFQEKNNTPEANYYKNIIINKFPNSPRARLLSDPEFAKDLLNQEKLMNDNYESVFNDYQEGRYAEVIRKSQIAHKEYEGKVILPRFQLLQALSVGKLQGNERLKEELELLIKEYPDHEVSAFAQEVIKNIYIMTPDLEVADIIDEAREIYSFDENTVYYFGISFPQKVDYNQLNFNLINFNLDNFDAQNLGIVKESIKDKNIILVQSFQDLSTARAYLKVFNESHTTVYRDLKAEEIQAFLISNENLEILRKDGNLQKYLLYYQNYYK